MAPKAIVLALIALCPPLYAGESNEASTLCRTAVAQRVQSDKGYPLHIQFGRETISPSPSGLSLVQGEGVMREQRRYSNIDYRCSVDSGAGRVAHLKVTYPGASSQARAEALCRQHLTTRLRRDIAPDIRLNIRTTRTRRLPPDLLQLTGELDVEQQDRIGRMRYHCELDQQRDRLQHLSTEWLQPLVRAGLDNNQCHQALRRKASLNGARDVAIESTERTTLPGGRIGIDGTGWLINGERQPIEYKCVVDPNGNGLESVNYTFK